MSRGERVVVPSRNDAAAYACVRSLARHDLSPVVVSEHDADPAAASRYCDEAVTVPAPTTDLLAYRDALLGVAARPDVRTILPVRQHDAYLLSKYRARFEQYVSLAVPSFERLRTVHDRLRLAEIAAAADVPVPETRPLAAVDDLGDDAIVKARYNVLADAYLPEYTERDCDVVKDVRHLRSGDSIDAAAVRDEMGHDPIVQEYVHASDEYMVGALCDHGEPVASFQHRQIRGDSYTGGGGVFRKAVDIPELRAVSRALLDELNWHGLACIEYLRDAETGEFKFAEVNPRLWQSLPAAVHAGAEFPYYYWLQVTGQSDRIDCQYEVGAGSHFLVGELGHLLSIVQDSSPHVERPSLAGTLASILGSSYRLPAFDYLRLDDPLPFIQRLRNVSL
ncbi:carboxylate--amine ligase [Halorientalis brevis]|uniref:Carboxylate--amine ligase n=1 Tax=Halorientalis brevis TaxID=1126241 RepID=A0ABD6C8E4_9EURY|nr:carboxylate--amine ligase [Halorientalis brevis]